MTRKRTADDVPLDSNSRRPQKKNKNLSANLNFSISASSPQAVPSPSTAYNGHPVTLPTLPEILDKSLAEIPFTHQGTLTGNVTEEVNISYDRLEFLGDAYLELIATRAIFPRFPQYSAGKLSQKRQLLVNNETLADFSLAYGFDQRARLPKNLQMAKSNNDMKKSWTKIMGDIFEAYVAAVILSDPENGFSVAEDWLTKLWSPLLSGGDDATVNMNAKVQLATRIMGKGVKIAYLDESEPDHLTKEGKIVFYIAAYVTGWGWEKAYLGSGKGLNKNEAGNMAAMHALQNPLTAQIAAVKRQFDIKNTQEKKSQSRPTSAKTS